jgi:hypothetical protein
METELQLLSVELDKEYVRNKYCKFEIVRTWQFFYRCFTVMSCKNVLIWHCIMPCFDTIYRV